MTEQQMHGLKIHTATKEGQLSVIPVSKYFSQKPTKRRNCVELDWNSFTTASFAVVLNGGLHTSKWCIMIHIQLNKSNGNSDVSKWHTHFTYRWYSKVFHGCIDYNYEWWPVLLYNHIDVRMVIDSNDMSHSADGLFTMTSIFRKSLARVCLFAHTDLSNVI